MFTLNARPGRPVCPHQSPRTRPDPGRDAIFLFVPQPPTARLKTLKQNILTNTNSP